MVHVALLVSLAGVAQAPATDGAGTPQQVFEQRIVPIFKSPNPSSCAQCHLAAVDLKDYILPSAKDTFLALRDQGLIDLDKPANSKILKFISRGANDRGAKLIPAKVRQAEYDAFAAWIKACAADPALKNAPKPEKAPALAVKPTAVVRHARKDQMLASFETNVWSLRFRCMNCHTEGTPQNDKLRKEDGDRVAWFKKAGPAATMEYLLGTLKNGDRVSGIGVRKGNPGSPIPETPNTRTPLINLAEPEKSLLLTKPLGVVKHGGGIKFALGDQGYKSMRAWITDVAAIKNGTYTKAEQLPVPDKLKQFGSEIWFKIDKTPDAWGDKLLQVDVYAWDAKSRAWEKTPIATSDRTVWGKGKLWQHTLTLLATPGSARAKAWTGRKASLPAGRYLVKVYVDAAGRAKQDWSAKLGDAEYVGQAEVQSRWPEGYGAMTAVDGSRVRK